MNAKPVHRGDALLISQALWAALDNFLSLGYLKKITLVHPDGRLEDAYTVTDLAIPNERPDPPGESLS